MGIVKSRYMYIDGQAMLAPGLDFIQNDPFATNEAKQGMAGMFGGRIAKLTADRAYSAGDRVFMSFGVKNSAESLEDHGIIPAISKVLLCMCVYVCMCVCVCVCVCASVCVCLSVCV